MHNRRRRGENWKRSATDGYYDVQDPAAFQDLIVELERMSGSQTRAAKRLGVSQSYFSRLRALRPDRRETAKPFRVSAVVVARLQSALRDRDTLRPFFSADARERLVANRKWRERELSVFPHEHHETLGPMLIHPFAANLFRDNPYTPLIDELRRRKCLALVRRMEKELAAEGHEEARVSLAILRILSPLLQSAESGGIERDATELTDAELRRYIQTACTRERILLNRVPEVPRAQHLGD